MNAAALLLFCLSGGVWAQGESGGVREKDITLRGESGAGESRGRVVQTETTETSTQTRTDPEIWTELKKLRDRVNDLERENADRPKVAFSVGLTYSGTVGPLTGETTLIFRRVHTNIGQAYNSSTGVFTAPVRGVYYFRYTAYDYRKGQRIGVYLYHNDRLIMFNDEYIDDANVGGKYISSALALEMEEGDRIYMNLPYNYGLFDDNHNRTVFSGFLLFPM